MSLRRTGRRKRRVEPSEFLLNPQEQRAALLLWRNTSLSLEAIATRLGVAEIVITRLVVREP